MYGYNFRKIMLLFIISLALHTLLFPLSDSAIMKIKDEKSIGKFIVLKNTYRLELNSEIIKMLKGHVPADFIVGEQFLICKQDKLYAWTYDGKLIGSIGKSGKGPGEFMSISDVCIKKNSVYIHDGRRNCIIEYKFIKDTFEYVDTYDVSNINKYGFSFMYSFESTFAFVYLGLPEKTYRVVFADQNFNVILKAMQNKKPEHFSSYNCAAKSKTHFAVTDLWEGIASQNKLPQRVSNKIFIYSQDGRLQKTIKGKHNNNLILLFDKTGKILMDFDIQSQLWHLYDVDTGKYITSLKNSSVEFSPKKNAKMAYNNERFIILSFDENEKNSEFYEYIYDFGI